MTLYGAESAEIQGLGGLILIAPIALQAGKRNPAPWMQSRV
jgi:hypothetical protein